MANNVNLSRRNFLGFQAVVFGAMLVPYLKPSVRAAIAESNNHRNLEDIVSDSEVFPVKLDTVQQIDLDDSSLDFQNRQTLEAEISSLRKSAKNTPSREEIISHYNSMKEKGILEMIDSTSKLIGIDSDYMTSILCIEQGSPYKDAKFGLSWISPSGCRGIGQVSFGAFYDVIKLYSEKSNDGVLYNPNLEIFVPGYKKHLSEMNGLRKSLTEIVIEEMGSDDRKIISPLVDQRLLPLIGDSAQKYMGSSFDKLFLTPEVTFSGKKYDSTEVQIDIVGMYFRKLFDYVENWEFASGAYNHGLGTTKALISKYEEKPVSISSLSDVIRQKDLGYDKIFDKKGMIDYFTKYKERTGLNYLDRTYPNKVNIAKLELEFNS